MSKKNVREVALDLLMQIEKNQAYSNLLLNQTVNKEKLSTKDVGLLTEMVYGTIQRQAALDFFLTPFLKKGLDKLDLWVLVLLRLSCYQIVYLDRVPERAIIHEAVNIAKKRGHRGISGMVNGVLRSIQREGVPSFDEITDSVERLAVETSHPEWMIKRWVRQFGEEDTKAMCEVNLTPPSVTVRVNSARTTVKEMLVHLREEGVTVEHGDLSSDAIKVVKGNVTHTNAFKNGLITIQDESSMLVGRALAPEQGMKVLDSCAAPGGKTTHLAELMDNLGHVTALDLHEHKVKLIQEQSDRLKLTNISPAKLDARKVREQFEEESFDRILVDAPCSGLGVIRRKPDLKWAKKESDLASIASIQQEILMAVAPLLKPGGRLVYSTCTIDREENQDVVNAFLAENKSFRYDETLRERLPMSIQQTKRLEEGSITLLPNDFQTDGFFIASLQKVT
ncbi:16S rRNA (cytosine(967)-C(5))-methyltransferase RsmB [Desertibacillus haloalkaliphilus]|uniref:16S rRNA (cytosine(967)-C(5))-methyltransferase RsmB n=1 Tax=Desertibacillus haloalkaliphilus TaxID=1328930 RepID=UPI001C27238D|nr:16S rRNA (cytosine(967)-C(5))-methyltransferase RsmB [Desertibacillus haloalkaliphilus]MBU8907062.1 16S rRNA (cytosine(967)-C(5))-methyltransferase RsmB [Desertibacillus haloalkaliphilus]